MREHSKIIGSKVFVTYMILLLIFLQTDLTKLCIYGAQGDLNLGFEMQMQTVPAQNGNVDVNFSGTSSYESLAELVRDGYSKMEVAYFVSGKVKQAYPGALTFVSSSTDGGNNWGWAVNGWNNIGQGGYEIGTAINQSGIAQLDFSSLVDSSDKLGNFGVQFAGFEGNITYQITSAKLIKDESHSSGGNSGSGNSGNENSSWLELLGGKIPAPGEISDDIVKLTYTNPTKTADWIEYSFSVKNNTQDTISGICILIPTSSAISDIQCFGNWSAEYVAELNGVLAYNSGTLQAGESINGTSDDKFGMNISNNRVSNPYVIATNCKKPTNGADATNLNYVLTGTTKTIDYKDTPVGKHGKLSVKKVEGYQAPVIVDKNGQPFQLRGSSTHGIQWSVGYNYINEGSFQTLRDEWGVNMIRLACYVTQGGYTESSGSDMDARIQDAVSIAEKLGMYVLIDWHVHEIGEYANPHDTKTAAETFFDTYSKLYKEKEHVLFEICNEPVGVDWYTNGKTDLYAYCNDITKIIRDNGSENLVICGTNTWSQRVDQVPDKWIDYENVLYTLHFYAAEKSHKDGLRATLKKALQMGVPVFVTEFGICSANGNGTIDVDSANTWIQLLDENNISYCCWQVSNLSEASSYLKSSCSKKEGGWLAEDLAKTGIWLVNTYRAHEEAENETGEVTDPSKPGETGEVTDPSKPGETGEVTDPSKPGETGEVTDPSKPGETGEVTDPSEPGETGEVTDPSKPVETGESTDPSKPGETGEVTDPSKPGETGEVTEPNKPGENGNDDEDTKKDVVDQKDSVDQKDTVDQKNQQNQNDAQNQKKPNSSDDSEKVKVNAIDIAAKVKGAGAVPVTGNVQIALKKSMKLVISLMPEEVTNQEVTFSSKNSKIATVSKTGNVTAKKIGKTTITVCTADGIKKSFTVKVVKNPVKQLKITGPKEIKRTKSVKLKLTISPSKNVSKKVVYKSNNPKVATVNAKGVVKALKKGTVKITAYALDGSGKKGSIKIKIK